MDCSILLNNDFSGRDELFIPLNNIFSGRDELFHFVKK